ncbi:hypothetical protein [Geobacter sp. SVR]|uniref:hypothetical protein n=1 Tax=Geobacter sp. SVR TaxID=2495594 RepID=UPI00143EFEEC|nr:hypothetical protein [Geobacter sp. SVR]BCS53819.1 hypothetical protein GSVR_21270 [Geobacter sp. SVR]GCF85672.1 hypothetical protein GSbR_22720 [Geobacter sp. SVR]
MELSRIVQQYAPALNQSERGLVSALDDAPSSVAAERYEQQIKALADARTIIKQMPDKKSADRQNKAEKIRMLKERLKMLKQMIPFMSPAAAKSLKAELQQIAAQLSSLAADGSGGTGGTGELVTGVSGDSGTMTAVAQTGASEAADAGEGAAVEDAPAGEDAAVDDDGQQPEETAGETGNGEPARTAGGSRQMQEEMEELKRLYRSVRNMVQRKLQQAGDKGGPLPNGPPPLQAYAPLPEAGSTVRIRA